MGGGRGREGKGASEALPDAIFIPDLEKTKTRREEEVTGSRSPNERHDTIKVGRIASFSSFSSSSSSSSSPVQTTTAEVKKKRERD